MSSAVWSRQWYWPINAWNTPAVLLAGQLRNITVNRKSITGLCAALTIFAFGTMTVGEASGANMLALQPKEPLLAIYGFPGANSIEDNERPVGQGLGRNFGFGQNMLFQAGGGKGRPLSITIAEAFKTESCDSFIGGTLMSNRTGKGNPLSFGVEFADFQCNRAGEVKKEVLTAAYADTQDQKWIAEICSPEAAAKECKSNALIPATNEEKGQVTIEHVAIEIRPGLTVQGDVWGKWRSGKPPCITLNLPPASVTEQTLVVTKSVVPGLAVGTKVSKVEGEACLISANNSWYSQSEKSEPEITIANE